ncbi:hypothetical protein Plec18167_005183 [Paecilomyces lecythidis]|uniref:MobA-like NTP transferase domain-containing protein n=1 Tax=Paecilomyces lecythidis TaxID=3004212 RepID=A0ABR3XLA5_9EURO
MKGASSEDDVLYMSLKDKTALEQLLREDTSATLIAGDTLSFPDKSRYTVRVLYDEDGVSPNGSKAHTATDIGPAAGLLTAHYSDPESCWLITACDYPLLAVSPLEQLLHEFQAPVTCFQNEFGFCEPLLSLWSPSALRRLQENVLQGNYGPSFVVKESKGKLLRLEREEWLFNTNDKEQWDRALNLMSDRNFNCQGR